MLLCLSTSASVRLLFNHLLSPLPYYTPGTGAGMRHHLDTGGEVSLTVWYDGPSSSEPNHYVQGQRRNQPEVPIAFFDMEEAREDQDTGGGRSGSGGGGGPGRLVDL